MYEQTQNDYGNMNVVVSTTCMNTDSLTHRSHMGEPEDQRKMGALAFLAACHSMSISETGLFSETENLRLRLQAFHVWKVRQILFVWAS